MARQPRLMRDIQANAIHMVSGDIVDALSFYTDLETEHDGLGSQYIPLTAAKKAPKLFAIGIIPPQIAVTGRALDRSASAAAQEDALPVPPGSLGGATLNLGDTTLAEATLDGGANAEAEEEAFDPDKGRINPNAWQSHPDSFWIDFVSMAERQGADPIELAAVVWNESNFDPGAYNPAGHAKGLIQLVPFVARSKRVGLNEDWDNFQDYSAEEQLPYVENYLSGMIDGKERGGIYRVIFGGHNNPDGSLYANADYQKQFSVKFPNAEQQDHQYKVNAALDADKDGAITIQDLSAKVATLPPYGVRAKIEAAQNSGLRSRRRRGGEAGANAAVTDPTIWATDGSDLSSEQRRMFDAIAGTGYNATKFGQKLQIAQEKMVKKLQYEIAKMQDLPPLRMLVNPNSFAVAHAKVTTDTNFSRSGPIVEHWGEEQDTISASGQLAGFYAVDGVSGDRGPGLTRMARHFSESYQNFLALYLLYRNNAGIYMEDQTGSDPSEKRRNLALMGSVYIYYDNTLYIGSFENFNITEADEKPFSLEYNFSFKVRASYLLDEPTDPSFTYGITGGFVSEQAPTLPSQQRAEILEGNLQEVAQLREAQDAANERLVTQLDTQQLTEAQQQQLESTVVESTVSESPQIPGTTSGDQRTKEERERNRARAISQWESGAITRQRLDFILERNPLD